MAKRALSSCSYILHLHIIYKLIEYSVDRYIFQYLAIQENDPFWRDSRLNAGVSLPNATRVSPFETADPMQGKYEF